MGYNVLETWEFETADDPEDESRKEVQIVEREDSGSIYIRAAYYGPSGRYGQDAPTYSTDEETQEALIEALQEAFPKARDIQRRRQIEEAVTETNLDPDELQELAAIAEEAGGVDDIRDGLGM